MDKSSQKRLLHEESDSSSDEEYSISPQKKSNISIETKSSEITAMSTSTEETSTPESTDFEIDPATTERSTSIIQGSETELHPSIERGEDSPDYASAKALENEYMVKYASVYTKELLFAIDVMTFLRHLHGLACKGIKYVTSGEHPRSPCNALMDEALRCLWTYMKDGFEYFYEKKIKTHRIDYNCFQDMVVRFAEKAEAKKYDEKYFLLYCVALADFAVRAERNGVPDAPRFIPLVICRTIQNLKDSGKITQRFWSDIVMNAVDIMIGDGKS